LAAYPSMLSLNLKLTGIWHALNLPHLINF